MSKLNSAGTSKKQCCGTAGERAIDITKQPAASWSLAVGMRLVCWPDLV